MLQEYLAKQKLSKFHLSLNSQNFENYFLTDSLTLSHICASVFVDRSNNRNNEERIKSSAQEECAEWKETQRSNEDFGH